MHYGLTYFFLANTPNTTGTIRDPSYVFAIGQTNLKAMQAMPE